MASYYLCPFASVLQVFTDAGIPLSGALLWTYAAGTSTAAATYTDNTGVVSNSNPIQMASNGRLPNVSIWQPQGVALKIVFSTNAGTTGSPAFGMQLGPTFDQISGIDDPTALLTLLSTTGASLVANAVIGYQAFSNLRSAGVPTVASGQALLVVVEGGDSIGDNKAGYFYWSPGATGADDDNNTIEPTGGGVTGRYLRLPTAGLPTLVNALGALSMVSGALIYGTSSTALSVLSPGADGSSLALSGGLPIWSAASPSTGVGSLQVLALSGSSVTVGSSQTQVFKSLPVVEGTYAMLCELDVAVSGGPSLTTIITSDQSGSITQVGTPVGFIMQESSGAYVQTIKNAAYPGISGQSLYNNATNYMRLYGRFTVPNATTSVTFNMQCGGGSSPSMVVAIGSYIQLVRII